MKELSEAMKRLQKEKLELIEGLLARLKELKKEKEDISFLCEAISEKIMEINSIRSHLEQERKEKIELRGRAWELEVRS